MTTRFLIVAVLAAIVFFANIWGTSIYILDEAKNATCAKEMYQRGDLVVPTFNGNLRTDKPPLHYYFMMLSYHTFGEVTPFTARFFSSLMGVFTVLVTFYFVRRFTNEGTAFFTGLVLVSSLLFAAQFHLAVPDPYLVFFMTTGCFFLFAFIHGDSTKNLYLAFVCLSLGVLTKGPVAVVLPVLGVLLYLLLVNRHTLLKKVWELKPIAALGILLVIVLPWYVSVYGATDGRWTEEFFLKHNVGRFTSTMEGHGGFPLAAPVIALVALLPSSVFIIQAVKMTWQTREENRFLLFVLCYGASILLFFTFSRTILPNYISPSLPFLAIVLGYYFDQRLNTQQALAKPLASLVVLFFLCVLMTVAAYFGIKQDDSIKELSQLALYVAILPMGALAGIVYLFLKKPYMIIYSITGSFIIFFLVVAFRVFPQLDQKNPVHTSRDIFQDFNGKVYYYGRFNPSFVFYHTGGVIPKIESQQQLAEVTNAPGDLLILSRKDKAEDLYAYDQLQPIFEQKDLFEGHTTVIFRKKASALGLSGYPAEGAETP